MCSSGWLNDRTGEVNTSMVNSIKESVDIMRIRFVGLNMGRNHARQFSRLSHEIVAGADIDPTARMYFANIFTAESYEDPERLLEADLDAVVITTPPRFHEPVAVPALKTNLDVFIREAVSSQSGQRRANRERRTAIGGYLHSWFPQSDHTRSISHCIFWPLPTSSKSQERLGLDDRPS